MAITLLPTTLSPSAVGTEQTQPDEISVSKGEYIEICQDTGRNPVDPEDGSVICFDPDGADPAAGPTRWSTKTRRRSGPNRASA